MMDLLHILFTTKDQREFNKMAKATEDMIEAIENKKQIRCVVVLLNRLSIIKTCDEDEDIIENLNARRKALEIFFEDK